MEILAANFRHCWDCKEIVSRNAQTCPYCGSKAPDGGAKTLTVVSLFLFLSGSWLFFKPTDLWGMICIGSGAFLAFAAWRVNSVGKVSGSELDQERAPESETYEQEIETHKTPTNQEQTSKNDTPYYSEPPVEQYWETTNFVKIKAALNIDYIDARGQDSNRTVFVERYDGSCYLPAFCEERQEYRTFRIDRIQSAVDAETGENIESVPEYLLNKYKSTPEYKLDQTFKKAADIIKILYYVGKSDSQLRKEELTIISDLIRKIAKDDTISDEAVKKKLNKMPVPSPQAYKLAVDRVYKQSPKNLKAVKNIVNKIIGTQKTVHKNEQDALDFINKKMDETGKTTTKPTAT